jgi:hypothetical protein
MQMTQLFSESLINLLLFQCNNPVIIYAISGASPKGTFSLVGGFELWQL